MMAFSQHPLLTFTLNALKIPVEPATITGREGLSEPFEFRVKLLSGKKIQDAQELLGKPALLSIANAPQPSQHIHGCITEIKANLENSSGYTHWIKLQPQLSQLAYTAPQHIYQNTNARRILEKVFHRHPRIDVQFKIERPLSEIDFCMQYNEDDLHFVERIIQDAHLHYYFHHSHNKHLLVITDHSAEHHQYPHAITLTQTPSNAQRFFHWRHRTQLTASSYHSQTHTPTNPTTPFACTIGKNDGRQHYCYDERRPSTFETFQRHAQDDLDRLQMKSERIYACSDYRGLTPGTSFKLEKKHYYVQRTYHAANKKNYRNHAHILPKEKKFVAEKRPIKKIKGPLTAIVSGPKNETLYTNALGQIKINYEWDEENKNEHSSCWVDVKQSLAGDQWGSLFLPRIGHTVLVDFIDGNPDKPVVIGSLYTHQHAPPTRLPQCRYQTMIKTHLFNKKEEDGHMICMDDRNDTLTIATPGDFQTHVHQDSITQVGNSIICEVKNGNWTHHAKKSYELRAKKYIRFECGDSTLTITEKNITLSAKRIFLN